MKNTSHCLICENSKRNINIGVYCGLTDKKPAFKSICDKLSINETGFKRIEKIYFEKKLVERTKWLTILHVFVYLFVGAAIIIGGLFLVNVLLSKEVFSTLPYIIVFLGLMFIPISISSLRKFMIEYNVMKKQLDELDNVLSVYGLHYEVKMDIIEGNHNILTVNTSIVILKNGKEISKYVNSFDYNNNEKVAEKDVIPSVLVGKK